MKEVGDASNHANYHASTLKRFLSLLPLHMANGTSHVSDKSGNWSPQVAGTSTKQAHVLLILLSSFFVVGLFLSSPRLLNRPLIT